MWPVLRCGKVQTDMRTVIRRAHRKWDCEKSGNVTETSIGYLAEGMEEEVCKAALLLHWTRALWGPGETFKDGKR